MSLATFKISSDALEDLLDLNIVSVITVDFYRALILKNRKKLLAIIFTEIFLLLLSAIFVLPIILLFSRASEVIAQNVLTIILGICLFAIAICNFFLWRQAKQNQYLAKLIEKVEKYNTVVDAIIFLDKLEHSQESIHHLKEIVALLGTTKNSLINSLKVAVLVIKQKRSVSSSYQLLIDLENNLNSLMTFDIHSQASEYRQLLNNALEIGISVHKEVRNLQRNSEI